MNASPGSVISNMFIAFRYCLGFRLDMRPRSWLLICNTIMLIASISNMFIASISNMFIASISNMFIAAISNMFIASISNRFKSTQVYRPFRPVVPRYMVQQGVQHPLDTTPTHSPTLTAQLDQVSLGTWFSMVVHHLWRYLLPTHPPTLTTELGQLSLGYMVQHSVHHTLDTPPNHTYPLPPS